jgi:PAS domain S-box-containing protein
LERAASLALAHPVKLTALAAAVLMLWPGHTEATMTLVAVLITGALAGAVHGLAQVCGSARELSGEMAQHREREAQFQAFVAAANALIWTSGADLKQRRLNGSFCALAGHEADTPDGQSWFRAIHADGRGAVGVALRTASAGRAAFDLEYRITGADGVCRWVRDQAGPRLDGGGKLRGYIGLCTDITERKAHEHERDELIQSLIKENAALVARLEGKPSPPPSASAEPQAGSAQSGTTPGAARAAEAGPASDAARKAEAAADAIIAQLYS